MVTVCHKLMQNIGCSVGIEVKNDPLNIPIIGFKLIFLKEVRSNKMFFFRSQKDANFVGMEFQ